MKKSLLKYLGAKGLFFSIALGSIFVLSCGLENEQSNSVSSQNASAGDEQSQDADMGFNLEITKKSSGYLQVKDGKNWKFVYCSSSGALKVSSKEQKMWEVDGRKLEYDNGMKLDCPEENGGSAAVNCECNRGGENIHTRLKPGGKSRASFKTGEEQYIGPNSGFQSCLKVIGSNIESPCNPDSKRKCTKSERFSKSENKATCDLFRMVR